MFIELYNFEIAGSFIGPRVDVGNFELTGIIDEDVVRFDVT